MTERTLRRISPKRIILSGSVIAIAAAMIIGATGAFFSDEETSLGNIFTAGAIDLQIDNESYAIDCNIPGEECTGELIASQHTSWELTDLTIEKFFDFIDLKPGDYGEDTISIHVNNNDAWLCAAAQITEDSDVDYTEPELEDDPTINLADPVNEPGELDDELNFVFWWDDGDNVLEDCQVSTPTFVGEDGCESQSIILQGTLAEMGQAGQIALADSQTGTGPAPGDTTLYIGKAWCFGELTLTPLPQDGQGKTGNNGPLDRDTGILCNGEPVDNAAQTDRVVGDIQFYAEQSRNNDLFLCSDWQPNFPDAPQQPEEVGADLAAYSVPSCDITATSTIQSAVDSATSGQTVCVLDGNYNETVDIEITQLTLASVNGPTNTATINGGVIIDAPDVTVTGFIIIPGNTEGSTAGVYLKEPADNATISYNDIDGDGIGGSPRGILNVIGTDLPGVHIHNNYIHDLSSGIYTNPHTGLWTIEFNDIDNNAAGIGQFNGANVLNNEFEHDGVDQEAIGIDSAWDANPGVVNFNNFLDGTKIITYDPDVAGTVDAENNFFNVSGASQVDETNGDVDFDPEAGGAYPHQ